MGRPIEYDREEIVARATALFWEKGYEGTSLEDVLRRTGFNRHSLYKEFGGKEGLFLEVLRGYEKNFDVSIGQALRASDGGLDAIRKLFDVRLPHDLAGKGCLMTNTLNEAECAPEEAQLCASAFTERLLKALHHATIVAQEQGDVPEAKDAHALATYMLYVIQGLGTMSKKGVSAHEVAVIKEQTVAFLKS